MTRILNSNFGRDLNVIYEEVDTETYDLKAADNGKTLVFTNVNGCKIESYTGTPVAGFNVRLMQIAAGVVQIGFLTTISGGVEDFFESDGGDIYLEYIDATLGWKTTGSVLVFDGTLGPELAPPFVVGGSGYQLNATNPPDHEIIFTDGSMRFKTTVTSQFMGLRINGIVEIGKNYRVTTVVSAQNGTSELKINKSDSSDPTITNGVGEVTVDYTPDANTDVNIFAISNNCDITLTSLSIKEIL